MVIYIYTYIFQGILMAQAYGDPDQLLQGISLGISDPDCIPEIPRKMQKDADSWTLKMTNLQWFHQSSKPVFWQGRTVNLLEGKFLYHFFLWALQSNGSILLCWVHVQIHGLPTTQTLRIPENRPSQEEGSIPTPIIGRVYVGRMEGISTSMIIFCE